MGLIGYARGPTVEDKQVLDRQLDALVEIESERIVEDHASGAKAERPGLEARLDDLRQGDTLVLLDLEGLGRLTGELVALIDALAERSIAFRAIKSPMDTTTPAGRAFLQIRAAFAEMERNVIRQRVGEGLKAVRSRKVGRPRAMNVDKLRYAQDLMTDRNRSISSICRELGNIPASTLDHYLHADGALRSQARSFFSRERSNVHAPFASSVHAAHLLTVTPTGTLGLILREIVDRQATAM